MATKLGGSAPTSKRGRPGSPVRAADSRVSALSARPDPIHCWTARRGTGFRSTTGRARNSSEATLRGRAARNRAGKIRPGRGSQDIHAFGPARLSILPDGLSGHEMPAGGGAGATRDGRPRASACGMLRKSIGAADPGISTLPARSDPIPYQMWLAGAQRADRWPDGHEARCRSSCRRARARNGPRRSIRVADPTMSALSARPVFDSLFRARNADRRPDAHETRYWPPHVYAPGAAILRNRSESRIPG